MKIINEISLNKSIRKNILSRVLPREIVKLKLLSRKLINMSELIIWLFVTLSKEKKIRLNN